MIKIHIFPGSDTDILGRQNNKIFKILFIGQPQEFWSTACRAAKRCRTPFRSYCCFSIQTSQRRWHPAGKEKLLETQLILLLLTSSVMALNLSCSLTNSSSNLSTWQKTVRKKLIYSISPPFAASQQTSRQILNGFPTASAWWSDA